MDPDGAMENAKSGVSHSSLDGANSGAAHRPHRPGDEVCQENNINRGRRGIFRRSGWGNFG
jgi:hypothetical protein